MKLAVQKCNKESHPPLRCGSCRWKLVGISYSQSRLSFISHDHNSSPPSDHSPTTPLSLSPITIVYPTPLIHSPFASNQSKHTQKTFSFSSSSSRSATPPSSPTSPIKIAGKRKRNCGAMTVKWICFVVALMAAAIMVDVAAGDSSELLQVKKVKGQKVCTKGWECKWWSKYCCNETISDYFQVYNFEQLFSKRNMPTAHAVGFYDYQSFIIASSVYQPLGFGTTGGKVMGQKEMAAFFGHVGSKTSCGYGVATGGPLAWGLCYNREMSPSQNYCDESEEYKLKYPCNPGADYYGRGALPIYWNYNYGQIGNALKVDLLAHPEYIEQNATLAFQAAIYSWMTPKKKNQPSAHDAFVGNWVPTKNDTLSKRIPGFGATMNIMYSDQVCGQGDIDEMNNLISHYLYYLDEMGIGREQGGNNTVVSCADQKVFNPRAVAPATASS